MLAAPDKSCKHVTGSSVYKKDLQKTGCPEGNLVEIAESLMSKLKKKKEKGNQKASPPKKTTESGSSAVHSQHVPQS